MSDLFFTVSKLVIPLLAPGTWLILLPALSFLLLWRARYRAASWALGLTIVVALLTFKLPAGAVLIRPLEQAIRAPAELPQQVHGIITLAGTLSAALTHYYEKPQLGPDAERVTEFLALARKYPGARLVFAGDSGPVSPGQITEAEVMKRFLVGQGVDPARVIFESKSRNTHESAVYTHALLQPRPGESWLLITSAFHMQRAYGTFKQAGWGVIPYPVSYRVGPTFSSAGGGYETLTIAIHEWVGIAAYRLTGRM